MMDNWKNFTKQVNYILNNNLTKYDYNKSLKNIKKAADEILDTPEHFGNLLRMIETSNKKIRILDHGCGSCITVLFLILKGFENVWGVTVNFDKNISVNLYVKKVNLLIQDILNQRGKTKRIFIYDGKKLPFNSNSFDFIFSQQVLEHVSPNFRNFYIYEEKRVLKDKGFLYHQIPHKLVPFEAHTKKWFIHWFPKKYTLKILGSDTNEYNFTKKYLFLEWPWEIKKKLSSMNLNYLDITHFRLNKRVKGREFGFIGNLIRIIFFIFFKIPYLGKYISKISSYFFMLEIIIVKKTNMLLLKNKKLNLQDNK